MNTNPDEDGLHAVREEVKSYMKKAAKSGLIDPTSYLNPFTKQPFENEESIADYWFDILEKMPPEKDLGS